jgi:protein gp37
MAIQLEQSGCSSGRKGHYRRVVTASGHWARKVSLIEEALDDPLKWRRPRTVFVNSMSDLFHEDVPLDFIQRVFAVMSAVPQHTFQVLTKRPERAAQVASSMTWPDNVWMGTSIEDQRVASRLEHLQSIPAHVRFLSLEPLLGPLSGLSLAGVHWIIVGGESGPHARPMRAEWVREIRDQARAARIPFFFKQWGGKNKKVTGRLLDGRTWDEMPALACEA